MKFIHLTLFQLLKFMKMLILTQSVSLFRSVKSKIALIYSREIPNKNTQGTVRGVQYETFNDLIIYLYFDFSISCAVFSY